MHVLYVAIHYVAFFFFAKITFLNQEGFFRQVKMSSFQINNLPKR